MKSFRVFRMNYQGGAALSSFTLNPLEEAEIPAYMEVYNACFRPMREALECSPTDFYYDAEQVRKKLGQIFVLRQDDQIAGSVAIYGNEIDDLIVHSDLQGRGIGRGLLSWAVARMQANGTEPITLSVADWNLRAIALYQSFGFEIFETIAVGKAPTEQ